MLLKRLLNVQRLHTSFGYTYSRKKISVSPKISSEHDLFNRRDIKDVTDVSVPVATDHINPVIPCNTNVTPMLPKETVILPFDEVPGPKSLKLLATFSQYLSSVGTQLLAFVLTTWLDIGTLVRHRKPLSNFSTLFDMYGPVVRFVSPVGGSIVLLNKPEHMEKVFSTEGEYPVRSQLDSLEKYRQERGSGMLSGLYSVRDGEEWSRRRHALTVPLETAIMQHARGMYDITDTLLNKIYMLRNHQDEIPKDLYREINKWAFDVMGLIVFSRKFSLVEHEVVSSQCEPSWLYLCAERTARALATCEAGAHLWRIIDTPAWNRLVKHCDNLHNLIGKYVLECEQQIADPNTENSLINSMLTKDKLNVSDVTTIIMDMLLLGVNTLSSSSAFLLYFLAKHEHVQRKLYRELDASYPRFAVDDVTRLKTDCPYLQACIKETLRLVPPIPLITRVLDKNITLDNYNIPRGTMIMMSTQVAALKESNFEDASKFWPERWLTTDDDREVYHAFATTPFGYGARKCLGQNIAETVISLLAVKILQKFKLEYHYGDIHPTKHFIAIPDKSLKIRFIDRHQ